MSRPLTKRQKAAKKAARVALWRRLVGARPAWIVTFLIALAGGVLKEWSGGMQRIAGLERDVSNLSSQRAELKAELASTTEILRRQVSHQCNEVCAK